MSNEQREQQQPQTAAPQQQAADRADFAKKGALAAIGGAVSGTARALWAHVLGDLS